MRSLRSPHSLVILSGYVLGAFALYYGLPEEIPPSWLGVPMVAFLLPTALAVTDALLRGLCITHPVDKESSADALATYDAIMLRFIVFAMGVHATVLLGLLGLLRGRAWAAQVVPLMLGTMMIAVGNLLPKTRPNLAIGIRTRRTLSSRGLWIRTHRATGYLLVISGAVIILSALVVPRPVGPKMIFLVGPAAIVATSFLLFKERWTMSVFSQAVLVVLLASPAFAQPPAFATISIKPVRGGDPRNMRLRVMPNGDLIASSVPVLMLVRYAYDVPVNPSPRLSGLPEARELYDIEAKAPANALPSGLQESEKRVRIQGMIRGLLADRFKLAIRVEQKPMTVYALTVANGGPNLQKSTIAERDCTFDTGTPEGCHNFIMAMGHPLRGRAINMDDLVQYIENWTDLPVVNRTELNGLFAVDTGGWKPMRLPPPPPGNNAPPVRFDELPTIFTVLRPLGLELKQQTATVPVYTVERIERPSAG